MMSVVASQSKPLATSPTQHQPNTQLIEQFIEQRDFQALHRHLIWLERLVDKQQDHQAVVALRLAQQACLLCIGQTELVKQRLTDYETAVVQTEQLATQLLHFLRSVEQVGLSSTTLPLKQRLTESVWHSIRSWLGQAPEVRIDEQDEAVGFDEPVVELPEPMPQVAEVSERLQEEELDLPDWAVEIRDEKRPSLAVYCLGNFQVYKDDQPITNWNSRKGQSIFKYLILHRERAVAKEQLMAIFWPDSPEDAARNNLNVAIYGLRKALRGQESDISHVLFENDQYQFNPELQIWVDIEQFEAHVAAAYKHEQAGHVEAGIQAGLVAEAHYQGDLFANCRHEEWMQPKIQQCREQILHILSWLCQIYFERQKFQRCIRTGRKILRIEPCQEETHQLLMRCYALQNQHHLAIRQYHHCVTMLKEELDVLPSPETMELYEKVRLRRLN